MQFTSAFAALLLSVSLSSVMALPSPSGLVATEKTTAVLMDKRTGLPVPRMAKRDDPSIHDLLNSCPKTNSKRLEGADTCTWNKDGNNGEESEKRCRGSEDERRRIKTEEQERRQPLETYTDPSLLIPSPHTGDAFEKKSYYYQGTQRNEFT